MMRWREIRLTGLSGGLLLSLILHGLIAAVLLTDLPWPDPLTEPEEQVVAVTLVPPPEPAPEPEPETAEAAAPPESEGPEPEAPEPEAEQQAAALPEGDAVPIPVLRPVFQYGAETAGPEIALDGDAAEAPADAAETPAEPVADPESAAGPEAEAKPEPETAAATETVTGPEAATEADPAPEPEPEPEAAAQDQPQTEDPIEPAPPEPALAMPADIVLPDAELAGETPAGLPEAAEQTETALLPDKPAEPAPSPPKPDPARAEPSETTGAQAAALPADTVPADNGPAADNGLPGVRKLSSLVDTGHAVATTAMGALPRDERGSRLCTSELREQLRRAPEPYRVELLPAYKLPGGTVLAVPKAAFRAGGAWYNLSFRCTVDDDALRVTDFTFKVGAAIPRAQWRQRGFPDL